jgi:DNA polymerase III delta prime subunit
MKDLFLWVEKYRPHTIEDCILPDETKQIFKGFLEKGEIPNLLLSGPPGIGKTTIAKALCDELGVDSYVINGSDEGRFLDTVRNNAKNFASTLSLTSTAKHKVIIIDEADNTTSDVQLLLRATTEEFANNCRFIFTCNYKNKIIEPLHSRCAVVDFNLRGRTKLKLAEQFMERVSWILQKEGVEFEEKVVAELILKYFPDFRRVINELQRYASTGTIDVGVLAAFSDVNTTELMKKLKTKEFTEVRKWVVSNLDNDTTFIMRRVYDSLYNYLEPASIPEAVLILSEYQYKSAFVADQEINTLAFMTEIMMRCQFK